SLIAFASMAAYSFYIGAGDGNGGMTAVGLFCLCMCFAVAGFMRYNTHPALVIMGDVGSLGIGGALAGAAIASKSMLILPFKLMVGISFIIINMYDGKRGFIEGNAAKYLFYIIFPLHLLIIWLLQVL
ncbi:MAG: hypothetical protein IKX51_02325, partial [Bacteroidales bacterium]|nr:hypothetical protein [Bacteroidales bacterium]